MEVKEYIQNYEYDGEISW